VISILDAAAISLGQQQLYIISHNALPPIDPAVVDKPTILAMTKGSQYINELAQKLKFPKERIYAGVVELSGGTLDSETIDLILGGVSTDPDDIKGLAEISVKLQASRIQAAGNLLLGQGGSLRGTDSRVRANATLFGGTMAPGTSIGELTIDGDLRVEDGHLEIEVGGSTPGQFDVLAVTGAEFQGGTIRFVFTDGLSRRKMTPSSS
jgi:hypothetical protein